MFIKNLKAINDYSETILVACGKAFLEKIIQRTYPNLGDTFYAEIGRYFFAKLKGESYKIDAKLIEIYTELDPLWNQTDSFRYIKCKEQNSQRPYLTSQWELNSIFFVTSNLATSRKKITEQLDANFDRFCTQQAQASTELQPLQNILQDVIKQLDKSLDYNSMLLPTSGNKAKLEALAEQINFLDIAIKFVHSGATLPDNITIELLYQTFPEYHMTDAIINALTTGKLLLTTMHEQGAEDLEKLFFLLQYRACQTEQAIQACNAKLFYMAFAMPLRMLLESYRNPLKQNQQEISSYRVEFLSAFEIFCNNSMNDKLFANNESLSAKLQKTITTIDNTLDMLSERTTCFRRLNEEIISLDTAKRESISFIHRTYENQIEQFKEQKQQYLYLQFLTFSAAPKGLSPLQQDVLLNHSQDIITLNKAFDEAAESVKACCADIDAVIKSDKPDFNRINVYLGMPEVEIADNNLRKVILLLDQKILGYNERMGKLKHYQKQQQAILDKIEACSRNLSQTMDAQSTLQSTLCLFLLPGYKNSIKAICNDIAKLQRCHATAFSLQKALSQRIKNSTCSETIALSLEKQGDEAPKRRYSL